jgi:hypothetical protein
LAEKAGTRASDLWRFLSAREHHSGEVQTAPKGSGLREEHRTRAPRASSLRVGFRDGEDERPKRLA